MIVVDVETSGQDPRKHAILSIGAVDFFNPERTFYQECRIFDGAEIQPEALAYNGFTEEQIKNPLKPSIKETLLAFLAWMEPLKDKTLAGQHPSFDRDFLRHSAERENIFWRVAYRTLDLHTLCYTHALKRKILLHSQQQLYFSTDEIYAYVGLPPEPRPHHALTGAEMETEAFSRLIFGKPLLKEFETRPLPRYLLP